MNPPHRGPGRTGPVPPPADIEPWDDPRCVARAHRAVQARRSSGRRRLVDPTTCEREYSVAELEFLRAIEEYKRRRGRPFPTWSEVLAVAQSLGYARPWDDGPTGPPTA